MWFFNKKNKKKLIDEIKTESIDMDGLFGSIKNMNQLQSLCKELSKMVHPDRFVNDESKQRKAEILFKKVQDNKFNYKELIRLKQEIEYELYN